ncbi:39S ribosomal protein L55, mitochondrial [Bulinus truncatus]|nr:39S ribosomal protein L55, mitochondrial [Bulinus truncatus]
MSHEAESCDSVWETTLSYFKMAASLAKLRLLHRSVGRQVSGVPLLQNARSNSNTTSICRVQRFAYPRTYPTLLVYPDGSTINIRYKEPREIIKLPIDVSVLSDAEKKRIVDLRKPKQKLEVIEEFETSVNLDEYSKFFKK